VKIAVVAEPYVPIPPQSYGGIEQIVYYLIRGLKAAGHEPILLAPGTSQVDCKLIPTTDEGLYFPQSKSDLRRHTALVKKAHRKTEKILRDLLPEIDIIHSHGFDLKNFKDFPNLTTLHNPIEFDQISYYQKRKELFYASISKNFQDSLPDLRYAGVVYNGEDPDEFPLVTQPEDYVCFLGRFDRDKCPHLAIQLALSYGIKIKLAGKIDHKGERYFEEEIAQYLSHPLVDYLGELGFEDKVELISHAKVNLHPTGFREPFGLTVVEAAYCGTPTMAISRGAMPELIEQGRSGLLVEDFVEGYHHLQECFAMDREYVASRARQLFSYKTMTQQYIDAYEHVLQQLPKPDYNPNFLKRILRNFQYSSAYNTHADKIPK
jgi:glycosyltransferase involved in cell wall biosynthesis